MRAPTLAEECGTVVRSPFDLQMTLSVVSAQPGSSDSETELASKAHRWGGKDIFEKGGNEIKVWKKQKKSKNGGEGWRFERNH
jgi:hypothetical protein